jgi:nicotinic acetylcholine receptor, invertebrate
VYYRNLETISIGTCRLHGSPKHGASANVSPHHRMHHHHHMYLRRSHSRVQNLDLMDDIPLPFQTDPHHLGLLVQESPMLSPNPPPSVVESNGQNLQHNASSATTNTLASGQSSTTANNPTLSSSSNASNFTNNTTTATNTTNVIINNIKTNTTSIGTTNLDSGVVQPTEIIDGDEDGKSKPEVKESTVKHRWHTCPELHKAMDGVTYIADHTKKEEESTRGEYQIFNIFEINS